MAQSRRTEREPQSDGDALIDALQVSAELTGTELTQAAAKMMALDLGTFPLQQVLGALTRCRRELKGRLTIAAVIERLDDGRPGPNEAWAMIPQDEHSSCVWTDEMAQAYGVAAPLLSEGQLIAARMAFIETYQARVSLARSDRKPAVWTPSLGWDKHGREVVLREALQKGRLTHEHVLRLLPPQEPTTEGVALLDGFKPKQITDEPDRQLS